MIRDTRAYVAVNVVGALAALFLLANSVINPPRHPVFPAWLFIGIAVFCFGYFVYQIIMKLSGRPVPVARWARTMTDRQLWIMKAVLIVVPVVIAFAYVMIFVRARQP